MKKSREFDDILDECLERMLVGGESLEQCLQSYPQYASELRILLETALATSKASAVEPRPEFRDRARHEFYSALREMEPARSRSLFSWQPRWAVVVTVILVLLLAGSGTVFAASRSMPDDFLYPVKLATEQVQLFLTTSALGKAELNAKLADKRVVEIINMANESKPEKIELAAQRLDTHLNAIADLAISREWVAAEDAMEPAFEKSTVPEEVAPVEEAEKEETPAALPAVITPPRVLDDEALVAGRALEVEAEAVDTDIESWAGLKIAVQNYSIINSARLRALLEKIPPALRPALLRAIVISEIGYGNAIESLD